ncbi:MAG: 16S rRNA (guanine(527)-N(7))-methyltransferase RsmG [Gammaproteobacteria bacterium]|nr:16S rRNA (guanine(527)-N(7))-methyltransferase RsmG [Gammaproteobacteria bacterium]MBU1656025.1 16S rRNA (guanine(527)-N(7))-methyltransferase RsmG [Gammaproteobacteria bacterium]MBU1962233.1 16S rRNA (guanine(527)-N(7))-methyltransferase RsmG [Gammaproteobacteria bacterium]
MRSHLELPAPCSLLLDQGLERMGLAMPPDVREGLLSYLALLMKWNNSFNLTAVRDPLEMVPRHLLDSLSIYPYVRGPAVLDVGTGPGLPGIPLALLLPEVRFTLLDSNGKKIRFVRQAALELGLSNLTTVQQRIEEYHPSRAFDTVMARAFTTLSDLYALCGHHIMPGGCLLAMKGTANAIMEESRGLEEAAKETHRIFVPFVAEERHIVIIRKAP